MSELQKHTFRLRAGDVDFLRDHYPQVPVNVVLREIIHQHIERIKAGTEGRELKMEKIDV